VGAQSSTVDDAKTLPVATREITDEMGRTVRVRQPISRIVSLAPSITETLYALDLQDRLVGDTDYCDYPEDAKKKTKVGGAINPSIEQIAALHPDIVLVTKNFNRPETVHSLELLGIPSYATDPQTVEEIISSSRKLGRVLGASETAVAGLDDFADRLTRLGDIVAKYVPRRVFFVVWREPLISIGKDTFIADALRHAGAISIIDSKQNWPQVNLEEVVKLQPEFLIFAVSHSQMSPHFESLATLPGWRLLEAVRNRRYAIIDDAVNRPAPRIIDAIETLAKQLHPEAFASARASRDQKNENPENLADGNMHSVLLLNFDAFSAAAAHGVATCAL
jgi:iron complex transport system substrate-binding protein